MNYLYRYLNWVKRETFKILPAVIYFALVFNLIFFTSTLIPNPQHHRYFTYWTVTIGAIIAGKALILGNALPWLNIFSRKPLIYNIVWKLIIYIFVLFLLWLAEAAIHLERHYWNIDAVLEHLRFDINSPTFYSAFIWVVLTFLIFIVASEFFAIIGSKKVISLLFFDRNK